MTLLSPIVRPLRNTAVYTLLDVFMFCAMQVQYSVSFEKTSPARKSKSEAKQKKEMAIGDTTTAEFLDEPIALIEIHSEQDGLKINHKALQLLQKLEGKVCVMAMAGRDGLQQLRAPECNLSRDLL